MSYCILALDGGGIRGLLTATILKRLDAALPGWRSNTKMMAGTSTGGLLAMGLGLGKTPDDIIGFYKNSGPSIFHRPLLREVRDLGSLIGAKYSNEVLLTTLTNLLGSRTQLQDLSPTVVIPSFNLDSTYPYKDGTGKSEKVETWRPKIFHNDVADPNGNDGKELCYNVGMRTSAAPTYFPSYGSFVDGGVVANNPSMVALAQALVANAPGRGLNDITLLSIGTGVRESKVSGADHNWGGADWLAAGVIDVFMDGAMDLTRYQCTQLLGQRFLRVSPYLAANLPLDDASPEGLKHLEDIANGMDLTSVTKWIQDNWK